MNWEFNLVKLHIFTLKPLTLLSHVKCERHLSFMHQFQPGSRAVLMNKVIFNHTVVKMEGELKRSQGRWNHQHLRFKEEDVWTAVLTGAVLHDSQPLCRINTHWSHVWCASLSSYMPNKRKINATVLWQMVTHSDVDLSFHQAKLNAVGFAFKQREDFIVVSTWVLYGNLHLPFQVLPRWISIWILQSVRLNISW